MATKSPPGIAREVADHSCDSQRAFPQRSSAVCSSRSAMLTNLGIFSSSVPSFQVSVPLAIFSSVGAWRMRPALSIDWHTLLEGDLVAHFVVHPNYQEDESLHRETLENLGSSPFAKKHVHIELAKEAREGPNAQDRAERLMAPPPRGRDCSPSADKHVNIVLAIRGLREPEHSRQAELSAWSSALNRTVDQIVDASIPQPQEESLENLGRSRSAEKYVHVVLAI